MDDEHAAGVGLNRHDFQQLALLVGAQEITNRESASGEPFGAFSRKITLVVSTTDRLRLRLIRWRVEAERA
jgi:hypothetical protein